MARRNKYLPPEDNQLYAENRALSEATYRLYDMINHHIGVNFPSGTMEVYQEVSQCSIYNVERESVNGLGGGVG